MYSTITEAIANYHSEDAILYCNENEKIEKLKYEDVKTISNIFSENLKYLSQTSICYGLLMDHNIYMPSLIISLQQLKCCFLFIDTEHNASKLLLKIGVKYIIAYNIECCIPNTEILFSIVINTNNVYNVYITHINDVCTYDNINYIIQTSGTTNAQKIVRVEHQCIASNIRCLKNRLHITDQDVIYYGTPLTFDPSMVELYLALTTGAKLLIASKSIKRNPYKLFAILFQSKLGINATFLQMCPSVFLQWSMPEIQFILQMSSLRILLLGGEDFPDILRTLKKSKKLEIYNIYGITEVSCWAFLWKVNKEEEINLGTVLDDTIFEIEVDGKNVSKGEGEFFIGSYSRICYLENEMCHTIMKPVMRKTGDRVMIDGNKIIYRGRSDHMIKRFGHRVNLLDIENIIHTHTGLKSICVWIEEKRKLVLFVLVEEREDAVVTRIKDRFRIKLLHILPKQCNPDYIELLLKLPLTHHGKVDKISLLFKASKVVEAVTLPSKCIVSLFSTLWGKYFAHINSDILHTKSFYELGGTSLLRIQFSQELGHNYAKLLPPCVYDYIFTNTYDKILAFLEKLQSEDKKRKLSLDHSDSRNRIPKNANIRLQIKWRYDLQACVDSTPVVLRKKRFVAVGSFSNVFAILNLDTGKEIFKVTFPSAIESSCLVSPCENYIYIGCYDHNMYCLEMSTGNVAWLYETGDCIKNKPNFNSNNTIIFGSYDKHLHCINAKTGTLVWKIFIGEAVTANSLVKDDTVIVATIKGSCLCLNKLGVAIWQLKFDFPIFGSPVELKNEFVVPDVLGYIHCINFEGVELWTLKVDGNIYSSILFFNECLIFGNHRGVVYCFGLPEGNLKPELKHEVCIDSATSSTAAGLTTEDGEAYAVIASISGYVYLINIKHFSVISNLKLDDNVFSSPIAEGNNIFLGCRDNNLICINVGGYKGREDK